MKHKPKDIQYCERLFQSFYEIGSTPQGGVTRLGYTETEDAMHEVFKGLGRELGGSIHTDEVGNTYVANTDERGYTLIGSHLDSSGSRCGSVHSAVRSRAISAAVRSEAD